MTPAISVALCTYNGERYLRQQLDSILNQTLAVDEIVVCDDASSDGTPAILEQYRLRFPGLFRIVRNDENLRSVRNFEKAISLCGGDIIFLADQDDAWVAAKVADYVTFFDAHPAIRVLASNGFYMDEASATAEKYALWDVPEFLREQQIPFDYLDLIVTLCNIATGASMAIRKEILPEILPFPLVEGLHHDAWIATIAAKNQGFELLNEKYFYYRIHREQQVGSVFYARTQREKKRLTELFDLANFELDFSSYKKRLKLISESCNRHHQLQLQAENHREYFREHVRRGADHFSENKRQLAQRFPWSALGLHVSDKILKRRQLEK